MKSCVFAYRVSCHAECRSRISACLAPLFILIALLSQLSSVVSASEGTQGNWDGNAPDGTNYSNAEVRVRLGALASQDKGKLTQIQVTGPEEPTQWPFISDEMESDVDKVVREMTLDEKLKMLNGDIEDRGPRQRGSASVDRVGIGTMVFYNGPRGYQLGRKSTLFPCGTAQAATFNPELVERIAHAIATELLAGGANVLEAPSINIIRDPLNGRNFEYFTEDPYLNYHLAAAFVRGGQDAGAVTTAKHLTNNNLESNRNEVDAVVSERALHEIYLPGFLGAARAGCLSFMTGANRVNGKHASGQEQILMLVKDAWNWPGFIYTDWTGARDTVQSFNAGLDLSMPGQPKGVFNLENLKAAIAADELDMDLLDDKVRRILRSVYFAGKLGTSHERPRPEWDPKMHQSLAFDAAVGSMTLLRNDWDVLPLPSGQKVTVLGPMAAKRFTDETGGSSGVLGVPYEVTALEGLRKRMGAANVDYIELPVDSAYDMLGAPYVTHTDAEGKKHEGFQATYRGRDLVTGKPVTFKRSDTRIAFNWEMASPDRQIINPKGYRAKWDGTLTVPETGVYTFRLRGSRISRLSINGAPVLDKYVTQDAQVASINLEKGRDYDIHVEFHTASGGVIDSNIYVDWMRPDSLREMRKSQAATMEAARRAEIPLLFVGQDHNQESEGSDRNTIRLPAWQEQLIRDVTEANPNTVVVCYAGAPIDMRAWGEKVNTLVMPWFAGIENGNALAALLAGDYDFGGRLPITLPLRYEDSPAHPSRQESDKHRTIEHNEGVFVGYRWFDAIEAEVAFPFGYGLSYANYAYGPLTLSTSVRAVGDKPLRVSVDVTNTSKRTGVEVVQLYVADETCSVPRPLRELKGFKHIELAPGETRTVTFDLDDECFAFWADEASGWVVESGRFRIDVGRSSRDLIASATIDIQ